MVIRTEDDFNLIEAEWYNRLAGRSLVVEADVEASVAIEALGVLGTNLASANAKFRERLFHRYPAILTVGLCAIASTRYDDGTFWPHVPRGLRLDANRQYETGKAFQIALNRMGLARFTTPYKYVGEILMHSGIPISSVENLVHTVTRWDDGRTSGDAAGFIRWAASMSQTVATTRGFDVPTYRFLTEGGEIAEDFIERVISAIDSAGGTADLPPVIAEAVGVALDGVADRATRNRRRTVDNAPTLTYDQHRGVRVRLPPLEVEVETAITWTVLAGGEAQRLPVDAPWAGDPIEPKWVGVRAPQQAVTVAVFPGDQRWELPCVDAKDPLLIFDGKTGALIPDRVSLPKGIVWLAFPAVGLEKPESLLEVAGEMAVTERGATPHGWPGWAFIAVDATKIEKLRVADTSDRWRYVTSIERPRLTNLPDPLPYITSTDGDDVLPTRPRLLLPGPRNAAGEIEWSVSIIDEQGTELSRVVHRATEPPRLGTLISFRAIGRSAVSSPSQPGDRLVVVQRSSSSWRSMCRSRRAPGSAGSPSSARASRPRASRSPVRTCRIPLESVSVASNAWGRFL